MGIFLFKIWSQSIPATKRQFAQLITASRKNKCLDYPD
tara:strand:- start:1018 stop:1131 length:114 start_codon:yes stop_codon:yes gene_type:complete